MRYSVNIFFQTQYPPTSFVWPQKLTLSAAIMSCADNVVELLRVGYATAVFGSTTSVFGSTAKFFWLDVEVFRLDDEVLARGRVLETNGRPSRTFIRAARTRMVLRPTNCGEGNRRTRAFPRPVLRHGDTARKNSPTRRRHPIEFCEKFFENKLSAVEI